MKHIALAALVAGMAIAAILLAPVRAQQWSATVSQTGSSFDPASLPDQEIGRHFIVKAGIYPRRRRGRSSPADRSPCPTPGRCRACRRVFRDCVRDGPRTSAPLLVLPNGGSAMSRG